MKYTMMEQLRALESFRNGRTISRNNGMGFLDYIRNLDGFEFLKAIMDQDVPECAKIVDIAYAKASIFIRNKQNMVNVRAPYSAYDVQPYWDYAEAVLHGDDQLILDICDPSCNRPIIPEKYDYIRRTSVYGVLPYWQRPRFGTPDTEYCHTMLNCSTNEHHVVWQSYIYWWAPDAIGEIQRSDGLIEFEYRDK